LKHDPFQSDLRVCTAGEPESELGSLALHDVQKIAEKTETFFSKIESQRCSKPAGASRHENPKKVVRVASPMARY
jgi:hypothetical protein